MSVMTTEHPFLQKMSLMSSSLHFWTKNLLVIKETAFLRSEADVYPTILQTHRGSTQGQLNVTFGFRTNVFCSIGIEEGEQLSLIL